MFESLTKRLSKTLDRLRGQARMTEENISEALREVRIALLEADVALPVVKDFISRVRSLALGQEVMRSLSPGQALIRVVRDELTRLMGDSNAPLNLDATPPVVILVAGLQGAGKTTTVAKLGLWLKQQQQKKVSVTSCDVYRPAAIEQLRILADSIGVTFFAPPLTTPKAPQPIIAAALQQATQQRADVLIIDTAGRLHIDDPMMDEIKQIHALAKPAETLFVVDSMTGQDAAKVAKAFDQALPLTGVILTKTDGDARGGAALSVRAVTGKPIKFIGDGEKIDALQRFHPDRMASRILSMGDVLTLIEEVEQKVDRHKSEQLMQRLAKGKPFDLEDFSQQLQQMRSLGGISSMLDKLPAAGALSEQARARFSDKEIVQMLAIISSMTLRERRFPTLLKGSRKQRIALGSGNSVQTINRLLKQFAQMQKMIKRMKKQGGMKNLLRGFKGAMASQASTFRR